MGFFEYLGGNFYKFREFLCRYASSGPETRRSNAAAKFMGIKIDFSKFIISKNKLTPDMYLWAIGLFLSKFQYDEHLNTGFRGP